MWELANISYKARVLNLNKNVGASNKEIKNGSGWAKLYQERIMHR